MIVDQSRPEVLALIPARGGSKGIRRKNLLVLAGRPLLAYSIGHAQQAHYVTRIIISTDDDEIAQVARSCGAEVPFVRPTEYAQDLSPDIDVFRHALEWLIQEEGYRPNLVVHLRPTGPVRRAELIDRAIELMHRNPKADSLRSVSWPIQTPYKMWRVGTKGYLEPLLKLKNMPDAHSMARQILPETFWQNGYVDIIRPRTILEQNSMTGKQVLPFIVDEPMHELDYPESIPVVEAALERIARGEIPTEPSLRNAFRHHPV